MVSRFVLKKGLLTRYENRSLNFNCEVCGQPLKVGEKVVSKPVRCSNPYTKHYHERCYESLFV